jgi:hypothetical protein
MAVSISVSTSSTAACLRSLLPLYVNRFKVLKTVLRLLQHIFHLLWEVRRGFLHLLP